MSKFLIATALGLGLLSTAGGLAQAHDLRPSHHRPYVAPHHHRYVPPPPPRHRPHAWLHAPQHRQYGWR